MHLFGWKGKGPQHIIGFNEPSQQASEYTQDYYTSIKKTPVAGHCLSELMKILEQQK